MSIKKCHKIVTLKFNRNTIRGKFIHNGGDYMENVVLLQNNSTLIAFPNYESQDSICEWDVIGDIFADAIAKQNLTKEQVSDIVQEIKFEVRNR